MSNARSMNWQIILKLSILGLVVSIVSHFYHHPIITPGIWVSISMICSFCLIRKCSGKYFLHGFLLGATITLWGVLLKYIVFDGQVISGYRYNQMTNVVQKFYENQTLPRILINSSIIGVISGCFQGCITFIFRRIDQYLVRTKAR
jgi:hypothetical protein